MKKTTSQISTKINSNQISSIPFTTRIRSPFYFFHLITLNKIMKHKKMSTYFQPILDMKENKTFGFEALNRPAPSKLFKSTDFFYDFVAKTNKNFTFECFCRNLSIQRYAARMSDYNIDSYTLFINVHPNILLDKNYYSGDTYKTLLSHGISPEHVVLELTERSAISDLETFERVLSRYRAQGYRIAVDDVGSGYNSLKTLVYLRPEFIKLDRSLISNIHTNTQQQVLLSVFLDYAQKSSTKLIAEGIETAADYYYLKEAGVHYAQGYAIAKPTEIIQLAKEPVI